jgi:hypothetical protein
MNFIDPKTDNGFRKIFGSHQSYDVLTEFLNSVLYQGENRIKNIDILNPYQEPRGREILKDTYFDADANLEVKTELKTGEIIFIEIHILNVDGCKKQILYSAAKAYSLQCRVERTPSHV